MTLSILDDIKSALPDLVTIRRDLHAHPELAFQERRTSDLIANRLSEWGIPVDRSFGDTGVVGIVKGGNSPRAIGLRADIDALPMTEHNAFAHASRYQGRMHACGHDGHTAMLLAAAQHLATHRSFDGTVYLIFQPAEEGGAAGARNMIERGLFERCPMTAIFGAHNWPGLPVGAFALASGPVFASGSKFAITVRGRGAHAAMPHESIDPLPVACQIVLALQTIITRNLRPLDAAVLSVTMIHGGEAVNVIPESCEIRGTVRAFTTDAVDLIEARMKKIAESTAQAFEATCDFQFDRYYPPTVNHPKETEFVRKALCAAGGSDAVHAFEPTLCSEDFGYYLLEKPGCYFLIGNGSGSHRQAGHGAGTSALHSPSYDFNDELIGIGGSMWVRLCEAWFAGANDHG